MKANKYMATLVASLAVVTAASAAPPTAVRWTDFINAKQIPTSDRLAGWTSFTATNPNATEAMPGNPFGGPFAGTSVVGTVSGAGYGNSENVYGVSNWTASSGGLNGAANVNAPVSFTLTNNGSIERQIGWLLFDVGRKGGENSPEGPPTAVGEINVKYAGPDGSGTLLASVTGFSDTADYQDFSYDITSFNFMLGLGESITFTFDLVSGAAPWLDNVAIAGGTSAIPEPGSMLALGCFLGSGLLIRRNRRSVA
jgi:hypothetical protein